MVCIRIQGFHVFLLAAASQHPVMAESVDDGLDCWHGTYNPANHSCTCDPGWGRAGVTDTLHALQGVCSQYQCTSAETCAQVLGIPGASCPVRSWNCYCGWRYAFSSLGTGYETDSEENTSGGKCMGVMYTFSVWATELTENFLLNAWRWFLALTLLLLPFGRKRANCDHHQPSFWKTIREWAGLPVICNGECVLRETYTFDSFKDDMAWSLFVLDVCIWLHLFMITLWIVALSIWSILLWLAVMVMLVCACVLGLLFACGEGLSCDCGPCDCSGECGGCCADDCFSEGSPGIADGAATGSGDAIFWTANDPLSWWLISPGYGHVDVPTGTCDNCCNCGACCKCQACCRPIAWVLYRIPTLPENAWGGLCGYFLFGTHQFTPSGRLYTGGSQVIDFFSMSWRRPYDLHEDLQWREQVQRFLVREEPQQNQNHFGSAADAVNAARAAGAFAQRRTTTTRLESEVHSDWMPLLDNQDGVEREVIPIGRTFAVCIDRHFDEQHDRCVRSSFEDYTNNTCWICTEGNDNWDMWLSCGHLFCQECSTQMLTRRMPCPLCRVSSSTVLRGRAHPQETQGIQLVDRSPPAQHSTRGPGNSRREDSVDNQTPPLVPAPRIQTQPSAPDPVRSLGNSADNPATPLVEIPRIAALPIAPDRVQVIPFVSMPGVQTSASSRVVDIPRIPAQTPTPGAVRVTPFVAMPGIQTTASPHVPVGSPVIEEREVVGHLLENPSTQGQEVDQPVDRLVLQELGGAARPPIQESQKPEEAAQPAIQLEVSVPLPEENRQLPSPHDQAILFAHSPSVGTWLTSKQCFRSLGHPATQGQELTSHSVDHPSTWQPEEAESPAAGEPQAPFPIPEGKQELTIPQTQETPFVHMPSVGTWSMGKEHPVTQGQQRTSNPVDHPPSWQLEKAEHPATKELEVPIPLPKPQDEATQSDHLVDCQPTLQLEEAVHPATKELEFQLEEAGQPATKELELQLEEAVQPVTKELEVQLEEAGHPATKELELQLEEAAHPATKELELQLEKAVHPLTKELCLQVPLLEEKQELQMAQEPAMLFAHVPSVGTWLARKMVMQLPDSCDTDAGNSDQAEESEGE